MAKRALRSPQPKLYLGVDNEWELNEGVGKNDAVSYQAYAYNADTDRGVGVIHHVYPDKRGKYARIGFSDILTEAILAAIKADVITSCPASMVVAGHWVRADLSMYSDFNFLKQQVDAVRSTYASTIRRLSIDLHFRTGSRRVSVAIVDSMLIAPEKHNSLAHIAPYVGLQKSELPPGYSKSEMKRFRDERLEEFNRYAICDAEITARYVSAVFTRFEALGIRCPVPTIGSAGVRLLKTLLPPKELREFLGKDVSQNSEKRHRNAYTFRNAAMMDFAAGCFHGGLNSIYRVGYSPSRLLKKGSVSL